MVGTELGVGLDVLDPVVRLVETRFLEASAWLALILAGRWLRRTEAVASLLGTLGLFVMLLGLLAAVGAFDPTELLDLGREALAVVNRGGLP
ncbi:hypothetical protein [Halorussus lipolyticus]|uniref:hypothetical protein n=1 Tax=Halorussus lipolyticus TaxID=3034024 RepID=UPI0023E8B20B|nr:hypothetical protein [Halorussus sp. DT80]